MAQRNTKIIQKGDRFGRLTVLESEQPPYFTKTPLEVICDCGVRKKVQVGSLHSTTKSCGCLNRDNTISRNMAGATHRHTLNGKPTKAYQAWISMRTRCYSQKYCKYKNYGGRGIVVCDRWRDSFENFLSDMGEPPTKDHSLERMDNNGNYSPENCKWIPLAEQSRNRRNVRLITYGGETLTLTEWAKKLGMTKQSLEYRLNSGHWTLQDAFNTPVRKINTAMST